MHTKVHEMVKSAEMFRKSYSCKQQYCAVSWYEPFCIV